MNRTFFLLIFLAAAKTTFAQHFERDTIRKNEFRLNLLPVFMILGGGSPAYNSNFSLGYNRYLKNDMIFRLGLSVFPFVNRDPWNGLIQFDRSVGDTNIYRTFYSSSTPKIQLEIGGEKLIRYRRFIHGLGIDLLLSHQAVRRDDSYSWRHKDSTFFSSFGDTTNHNVDTLGMRGRSTYLGVGFNMFYSLRYQLTKHWYVTGSIGPSFAFVTYASSEEDFRTKKTNNTQGVYFELLPVPVISNLSINFRF